jgi:hypothetical protein
MKTSFTKSLQKIFCTYRCTEKRVRFSGIVLVYLTIVEFLFITTGGGPRNSKPDFSEQRRRV